VHAILQSGNLYAFGINNPILWTDPSGLFIIPFNAFRPFLIIGGPPGCLFDHLDGGGIGKGGGGKGTKKPKVGSSGSGQSNTTGTGSTGTSTANTGNKAPVATPSWGNNANLVNSASTPGQAGITPIGRAFQKHNNRPGTAFTGSSSGNAAHNKQQGMSHLNQILNNPNSTFTITNNTAHGMVLKVRMPCGKGAMWTADGNNFIMFLEP